MRVITLTGLLEPVSLALDWVGRNLYVVDRLGRRIDVVSVTRPYQHNIISYTVTPSDIAVDPGRGSVSPDLVYTDTGAKYCNEYVCLSVCLSVRTHKSPFPSNG